MASILSIDIGGTRIKAAVISKDVTLKKLQTTDVEVIRKCGWLNSNLPRIVDPDLWASFTYNQFKLDSFDSIAIDGPWSVKDNKISGYYIDTYKIPSHLTTKLSELTNRKVISCINDAVAWLKGIIRYSQLVNQEIKFPVFAVILGTGTGLAYAGSIQHVSGIELGEINCPFDRIRKYEHFKSSYEIHNLLSENGFFKSLSDKDERKQWDYDKIRAEYTLRVNGLVKDVLPTLESRPSTIVVGGGFSEFVSQRTLQEYTKIEAKVVRKLDLKIKLDLIPLLGNIS